MIREALAGKRLFVTGTTGFLGTALVERLLRSVPDCELVLLVRPGKRSTIEQRAAKEIFANDCFDRLREQHGGKAGFEEVTDARVQVVAGDVGRDGLGLDDAGRAALGVVRHRHPLGRRRRLRQPARPRRRGQPARAHAHRRDAARRSDRTPHLVALSTCYVAGNRRGSAPEKLLADQPFSLDIDWRREVAGRPPHPGRLRRREPRRRDARAVPQRSPGRARAARARRCWPRRPSSAAPGG